MGYLAAGLSGWRVSFGLYLFLLLPPPLQLNERIELRS